MSNEHREAVLQYITDKPVFRTVEVVQALNMDWDIAGLVVQKLLETGEIVELFPRPTEKWRTYQFVATKD